MLKRLYSLFRFIYLYKTILGFDTHSCGKQMQPSFWEFVFLFFSFFSMNRFFRSYLQRQTESRLMRPVKTPNILFAKWAVLLWGRHVAHMCA